MVRQYLAIDLKSYYAYSSQSVIWDYAGAFHIKRGRVNKYTGITKYVRNIQFFIIRGISPKKKSVSFAESEV